MKDYRLRHLFKKLDCMKVFKKGLLSAQFDHRRKDICCPRHSQYRYEHAGLLERGRRAGGSVSDGSFQSGTPPSHGRLFSVVPTPLFKSRMFIPF